MKQLGWNWRLFCLIPDAYAREAKWGRMDWVTTTSRIFKKSWMKKRIVLVRNTGSHSIVFSSYLFPLMISHYTDRPRQIRCTIPFDSPEENELNKLHARWCFCFLPVILAWPSDPYYIIWYRMISDDWFMQSVTTELPCGYDLWEVILVSNQILPTSEIPTLVPAAMDHPVSYNSDNPRFA